MYNAIIERENNIIGKRIREARKQKGLNLVALSERLKDYGVDLNPNSISAWENCASVPNIYQFLAVCSALDMEEFQDYCLASGLNPEGRKKLKEYKEDLISSGRYQLECNEPKVLDFAEYKIMELKASAGTGNFLDNCSFHYERFLKSMVPQKADFGIYVSGDSMEPYYKNGQLAWVQHSEEIQRGQVGIFIYDGEGYIKALGEGELISYNEKYKPIKINPELPFYAVGRVVN